MKTIEAIETRRAIKHYDADYVMPDSDLNELIRLTKLAPSSFNMQNYRLLVVRDPELRKDIRAAAWDQGQVTSSCAPTARHTLKTPVFTGVMRLRKCRTFSGR